MRKNNNFFNDNINFLHKQELLNEKKKNSNSQILNESQKHIQLFRSIQQKLKESQCLNTKHSPRSRQKSVLAQVDHKIDNLEFEIFKSSQKYDQVSKSVNLPFIFQDQDESRRRHTNYPNLHTPVKKPHSPSFFEQTSRVKYKITKKYLGYFLPNNASLNRRL